MPDTKFQNQIADFIRNKGVTRCPTACVASTESRVSESDRAALRQHAENLNAQKAAKKMFRSKKAG